MAQQHSPLHQFEIQPLAKFEFAGVDLSFTNSALFMVLTLAVVSIFLTWAMRKRAMVPDRAQAISEFSYQFVAGIIKDNIGPEGRKFFPLIFSLFMFILLANLLGMIPYSFTVTSHIAVTFALAMLVFLTVVLTGIIRHGFHFIHLFMPPGVPKWMIPIMMPIEMVSFVVRPVGLSIRLAAAMTAGHVILKVIAGFIGTFILALGLGLGTAAGLLPLAFLVLLIALEVFIAFLQAYIFSLLTSIYLNDAIHLH